jgi:long-chain acyl-CoA synthetase
LAAAGAPVFGVELRIIDSQGHEMARGEAGEVCAHGGNLMSGYWGEKEDTEKVLRDGWYHTGDVGYLDARGFLHLTDRIKDMIVTGGENVYSIEVEDAIASHPSVQEVAVIGIPSDVWGEAVHAVVVLKEGMKATGEQVIEHARQQLTAFKVPKSVEFHDGPLPLSGAFKPLKRELRRRYWEGHDRQVG